MWSVGGAHGFSTVVFLGALDVLDGRRYVTVHSLFCEGF